MASQPSTPAPAGPQTVVSDAPTGNWTHPRMPEIQQRLNKSLFGEKQVREIVTSLLLLAITIAVPALVSLRFMIFFKTLLDMAQPFFGYALIGVRGAALVNIGIACLPLVRAPDDLSDIPLTPTQRKLLGLPPTSKPATPGSQYITPPRYSRTPTPRSSGRSLSGSPFSDSASVTGAGNSYSPSASPLFQKAVGRDAARRTSFGSPASMNVGKTLQHNANPLLSNTPSPTQGRNSSIAVSSKWLFEKSKANGLSLRSSYG